MVSELISAKGIMYDKEGGRSDALLAFHEDERPLGLQLFGEDIDSLVRAAQYAATKKPDFIDINCGCPVAKVVTKGAGSALCRDPRALGIILSQIKKAISIPLSIKIRTGWDENRNAHEIIKYAADAGVSFIAVHGRTRAQGYQGSADWDYIGELAAKSPIPIIGNGDIESAQDALHKMHTYNVPAVMIGRGALRRPFIFKEFEALYHNKPYEQPSYEELLSTHARMIEESSTHPKTRGRDLLAARKFIAWYSSGFPGCHAFRASLFAETEPKRIWDMAHTFFTTQKSPLTHEEGPFLMGGHG